MSKNNKDRILEEISIPDDIFYQKYSTLNIDNFYPILFFGKEYSLANKQLETDIIDKKEMITTKKNSHALSYKISQEQKFDQKLSWNKLKKILTIEQSNVFIFHEYGKNLYLEIEKEIAKEEIQTFNNNIEKILTIETRYLREYINHIEKLLVYNTYFKESFLESLFNFMLTKNLEMSYIIRFFNQKDSTKIIHDYIFSHHLSKLLSFKKNNRNYIILVAIFVSNMLEIKEGENQVLGFLELSEEENEKVLNKIEFLEDKEIENE